MILASKIYTNQSGSGIVSQGILTLRAHFLHRRNVEMRLKFFFRPEHTHPFPNGFLALYTSTKAFKFCWIYLKNGLDFLNLRNFSMVCFPALRLHWKNLIFQRSSLNGVRIPAAFPFGEKRSLIVRASSETDGNDESELQLPPSEGSAETVSVENLPLESKLQMKLDQKLRMKLAKKIRLRRKRLVRKRRMRKKGRWPPSKMKKNKNV